MFAWTVNKSAEQEVFRQQDIPFFTDSAVNEMDEAWTPPERRVKLSNIKAKIPWKLLAGISVLVGVAVLVRSKL